MKRWFTLEGFYTSDSRGNPNRQPYDGLHVSHTCQQGNHPTGLTSALYSHATDGSGLAGRAGTESTVATVAKGTAETAWVIAGR
jgi:hypothetical protein